MHATFIFLLMLAVYDIDQSRVLIEVGVPGADFYLDGNFVQQTDAHGSLQMEGFPPGTFRFMIKKSGYLTYHGSFTLGEGESKNVKILLHQIAMPNPQGTAALVRKQGRGSTVLSHGNDSNLTSSKEEPAAPVKPVPEEIAVAARPIGTQAAEDSSSAAIWAIPFGLGVLLFLGFLIRKQKAKRMPVEPSIEQTPVSIHGFIEKLKRQEVLDRARFADVKALGGITIDKREKEIVIDLPKEAYTSEEEP